MIKPLIPNKKNKVDELKSKHESNSSNSNDISQVVAESFAKILWKKKFKKSSIQANDDQIIMVIQEVYRHPDERKNEVWDWILDRDMSFLLHAVYKHRSENLVLVCYRWTDFKNLTDLLSDVQIVLWVNWIDTRVQRSLDFFDDVQMKYPDARKWICWHSLGGTISYIVTKHRSPERCVVFNPWSSPTKAFLWMMKDTLFRKNRTKCITTYKVWWDIVSTLSFIWNVKNFTVKSANPLTLHAIDTFSSLFESENDVLS